MSKVHSQARTTPRSGRATLTRPVRIGRERNRRRLQWPRHSKRSRTTIRVSSMWTSNIHISEVVGQTRCTSAHELEATLMRYMAIYNERIPQRALNHLTPVQALQEWQKKKPELFSNPAYNHAGLDNRFNPKDFYATEAILALRHFYPHIQFMAQSAQSGGTLVR